MTTKTVQSQNRVVELTASPAGALTAADSGNIYLIMSAAAPIVVTLPAPASNFGLHYTFMNASNVVLANTVTITSPVVTTIAGHCINGTAVPQAANANLRISVRRTSLVFDTTAVNPSSPGDYIDLISNGTNYLARCYGNTTETILGA